MPPLCHGARCRSAPTEPACSGGPGGGRRAGIGSGGVGIDGSAAVAVEAVAALEAAALEVALGRNRRRWGRSPWRRQLEEALVLLPWMEVAGGAHGER